MTFLRQLSDLLANAAAWAMFGIGLMLGYEVAARYFFNSPTIWAEELSRLILVWAVFVGAAVLVRHDGHIRVTLITGLLGPSGQKATQLLSLAFITTFAAIICWNSLPTVLDSFARGRSTGSMMDLPSWLMQAAVPVGFGLCALHALAAMVDTACRPAGDQSGPATDSREI